jgi:hypothetical protein
MGVRIPPSPGRRSESYGGLRNREALSDADRLALRAYRDAALAAAELAGKVVDEVVGACRSTARSTSRRVLQREHSISRRG